MKELGFGPTADLENKLKTVTVMDAWESNKRRNEEEDRKRGFFEHCAQEHGEARALTVEECIRVQVPDSSRSLVPQLGGGV